ncbi:hypothetical protein CFF91_21855 [Salmonella enterica]|nr:hypothetical protein [Salmonella enterica]EDC7492534.1 hypothetical protein [Salmonella enterica]
MTRTIIRISNHLRLPEPCFLTGVVYAQNGYFISTLAIINPAIRIGILNDNHRIEYMTPKGQFDITLFVLQINLFHKEHH